MQWKYEYQFVVCVLSAVRHTDDFKETVTLARLHHMLPDDGP